MVSVVSVIVPPGRSVDQRIVRRSPGGYPASPGTIPDLCPARLRKKFHAVRDRSPLARSRLALRRPEVDQSQEALAVRQADRLAAARRAQDPGRAPVGGEPALRGAEQDERDRRRGPAHVLLVLDELAGEHGRRDDEGRRAVELQRLRWAGGLLQAGERLRPKHAEAPGLRQGVVGGEARELEQLEQRLARHRLRAERLVRAPRRRELAEAGQASRADTCTSQPAFRRSLENGQPSSALSTAACSASSSSPSTAATTSTCDARI